MAKKKITKKATKTSEDSKVTEGKKAPSFKSINQDGKPISLKDFEGKKLILYFYPKDLTPGCTQESCDFRDTNDTLKKLNAYILGVSKDTPELHKKFISKYNLNFDLIADVDGTLCKSYDVIKQKNMYGKKFLGIERTTFLIDEDGIILKRYSKVKVDGHIDQIIKDIKSIE